MNIMKLAIPLVVALAYGPAPGLAAPILQAELASFAVLGATGVTNASGGGAAATIITGNLGVSPGPLTSITGFPPGIVIGSIQPGTEAAAEAELTVAYLALEGAPRTGTISAGGLSGANLVPGVYDVTSTSFDLTTGSTLFLNALGNPFGSWVFRMSSSLITGVNTTVDVSTLGANNSVYWVVRSAATLGDNADFAGNILALAQIAFDPGATDICGRALSRTANVTFAGVGTTPEPGEARVEANQVGGNCGLNGGPGPVLPEPGTLLLFGTGLAGLFTFRKRLFAVA